MTDEDLLAGEFESHRTRLRAMAFRMLGSSAAAEDAVQEAGSSSREGNAASSRANPS